MTGRIFDLIGSEERHFLQTRTEWWISFTRRRWVNELQVEYNLNNSEFVDKWHKNYFLYSIT